MTTKTKDNLLGKDLVRLSKRVASRAKVADVFNPYPDVFVKDPSPSKFLVDIGRTVGLDPRESDDYSVIFNVESPLIAFLEIQLLPSRLRKHRDTIEISYLTPEGDRTIVDKFPLAGDLSWIHGTDLWILRGKQDNKKEIRKLQEVSRKKIIKKVKKVLKPYDTSGVGSQTEMALLINEKMGLGIDPKSLHRVLNILSIWEG